MTVIDFSTLSWKPRRNPLPDEWWMPAFDAAGLQPREGQLMAFAALSEMFSDEHVTRIGFMAGTGVGKSLIAFAIADAAIRAGYAKVIISTASISLGQQYEHSMYDQDDHLPHSYAVSSGLDNTLCTLALQLQNNSQGIYGEAALEVPVHIAERSTRFSRWPISKEDKNFSVRTASDRLERWPCYPNSKTGEPGCEFIHECAVYHQRDRSFEADIIVANAIQVAWLLKRQPYFDANDVFLIVDEADKAVQQLPLDRFGVKYPPVTLDEVLDVPRKTVFMSGTLTPSIADRLGCQRYLMLPHLNRDNAPVLIDQSQAWYDRLGEFAERYKDKPGLVVLPNGRMRDVAREVLTEAGFDTVDYDMTTNRAAIKADHIDACRQGKVPPVLLGFHAGAGIGLDLPGDLLGWLAIVGRPYGSDCSEDRSPVRDEAERSDNLIVQAIGRACRFDGDSCRVVWYTSSARDVDRVIQRVEEEGVTVCYSNTASEVTKWLGDEQPFSWQNTTYKITSDDDW